MADIHPNDIGLATYEDVGDVAKLKTAAKVVVDAINEIYTSGGGTSSGGGSANGNTQGFEQIYVDGENNIIIGENNIVYGNNNFIIGSDNVINADNLNFIGNKYCRYDKSLISISNINIQTKQLNFYLPPTNTNTSESPINAGDKVVFNMTIDWVSQDYMDFKTSTTPMILREALEVDYDENTQSGTITLEEFFESVVPPTETCNIVSSIFANEFVILSSASTLKCSETAISFGGESTGNNSFATANAKATGNGSFAANIGKAENTNAAAFGSAYALAQYSFGANSARCEGSYGAAFNSSDNYTQYSFSTGCGTKILGRALKGVSINGTASTVTIESGQNTTGIVGKKIIMRCYNQMNSYMLKEGVIDAVNDTVLTVSGMNFNTYYPESLFPDKYIFIIDTSASYSTSDLVSGYYAFATSKYTFAHGMYVTTAKDGSVIFGKYGTSDDEYSLALANGTSLKEQGLAFKVLSDGRVNADGAYTTPCADYAEFFEWADGNQDYEDRAGYFVKLEGEKIVKCNDFDEPLGIVSATPAIIGDSGELHWKDKFVTDDFGRIKYHDVVVPQETDEDGNVLIEEHIETQPVINPEWNNDEEYIPRNKRPEWSAVGVLGKLIVYDDGTLKAGDVCRTGPGGIAVKSVKNGYQVLKRISDDKIMIWFKG